MGVMDPGLAGEVILPRTLASFFPVGRKVARGPFWFINFLPNFDPLAWFLDRIVLQCRKRERAESLNIRPRF